MIAIVPLIPAYFIIAMMVHGHYYIHELLDGSNAARRALFWPLYLIRWLVVNFVLAIMGK